MDKVKKVLLCIWAMVMVILLVLQYFVVPEDGVRYMLVALAIGIILGIDIIRSKKPRENSQRYIANGVERYGLTTKFHLKTGVVDNIAQPKGIKQLSIVFAPNVEPRVYDPVENAIAQKIIWVILALAIIWFVLRAFQVV